MAFTDLAVTKVNEYVAKKGTDETVTKVNEYVALKATDEIVSKLNAYAARKQTDMAITKVMMYIAVSAVLPAFIPFYPILPGLDFNVVKTPSFPVSVATAGSGRQVRTSYSSYPRWLFTLQYSYLPDFVGAGATASDLRTLLGFFAEMYASESVFAFLDPDDNSVSSQAIAIGDGLTTTFTLVHTYGIGSFVGTEPVGYVSNASNVNVYLNGVLQASGSWGLSNPITGLQTISFSSAPAAGVAITVDIATYYYKCRFADATNDFAKFANKFWSTGNLRIQSLLSSVS